MTHLFERDANLVKAVAAATGLDSEKAAEAISNLDMDGAISLVDAASHDDAEKIVDILKTRKVETTFGIGDEVKVAIRGKDGKRTTVDGVVKVPEGPGETMGVLIDGGMKMVKKKNVKLAEGVLGMTGMPGLNRLKELAGMVQGMPEIVSAPQATVEIQSEVVPAVTATPVQAAPCDATDPCAVIMSALDQIEANMPEVRVGDYKRISDRLSAVQNRIFQESYEGRRKKPV